MVADSSGLTLGLTEEWEPDHKVRAGPKLVIGLHLVWAL